MVFQARDEVWDRLKETPLKNIYKSFRLAEEKAGTNWIESGESALSFYSDLATPEHACFALSSSHWKSLAHGLSVVNPYTEQGKVCLHVFKEDPELFAYQNKYLNPIELYFLLSSEEDERIQIALAQMLADYDLTL